MRCVFYGLGADGTVGANKNSIKIIGEETDNYAQGYFVYDSKKSGSVTISHLRFGPRPIRAPYLISQASFVACHQFCVPGALRRAQVRRARRGLPAQQPLSARRGLGRSCPYEVQQAIVEKRLRLFVIDAYKVARATGMGGRINTIMQTCFFAISGVLPRDEAIDADQAQHQEDLRQARRGGRAAELPRGRRDAGAPARGRRAPQQTSNASALRRRPPVPDAGARVRARRARPR